MKRLCLPRRCGALLLSLAALVSLSLPASAFFWNKKAADPTVPDFSKNTLVGGSIAFSQEDFSLQNGDGAELASITLTALPDAGAGSLTLGGQPLAERSVVERSALEGLRFQALSQPSVTTTSFSFLPSFDNGAQAQQPTTVTLYLLTAANEPPIARNMDLTTYKNVAITGYFDAVDSEGDTLTFQLMDTPARGAVTLAEDGSAKFVYTPYENKTGKDSFTYVAIDSAGNTSSQAKVTVQINKPDTKVTYADMEGDAAHKASIRLAEEGVFVGSCLNGEYFFDPDRPVTRAEFLSMAMATVGMSPLEDVTVTGFTDDDAIPTWAKGAVSAAVMAGVIQGSQDERGAPVFEAEEIITQGEATVMLDQLLQLSDVPLEVFSAQNAQSHWAGQSAANLAASGVIRVEETSSSALAAGLDRAQAAMLLDGALDVLSQREGESWLPW